MADSFGTVVDYVDTVSASHINELRRAIETGWIPGGETWTYASATTFTVSGDVTTKYQKGTKIKLTQTSVKYFYITTSAYAAPNTTVTVTGGSDYSLANAAITLPYYSYADIPQSFPDWFNYSAGQTGYSTTGNYFRFKVRGRECIVMIREATAGTSTSTSHTLTLPIAAVGGPNYCHAVPLLHDNSVGLTTPGRAYISGTTLTWGPTSASDTWTASGTTRHNVTISYEI